MTSPLLARTVSHPISSHLATTGWVAPWLDVEERGEKNRQTDVALRAWKMYRHGRDIYSCRSFVPTYVFFVVASRRPPLPRLARPVGAVHRSLSSYSFIFEITRRRRHSSVSPLSRTAARVGRVAVPGRATPPVCSVLPRLPASLTAALRLLYIAGPVYK